MEEKYVLKIQENEDRSKSNTKRLDEHDKKIDELSDMYVALTKVDNKVTNVEKDVTEIKTDLKSIKEKPSKRWEQVVNLVITRYRNSYTGFSCCKIRIMRGEMSYGTIFNVGNDIRLCHIRWHSFFGGRIYKECLVDK